MSTKNPRYGTVDREYGMKLTTTPPDKDGPVWMVNLMKYREVAEYTDGRQSTVSGQEADELYSPLKSLAAVGAEVVFFGDVDQQLAGDGTEWDRIAVVKYPTRQSFIAMQSRPEFKESHQHKDAGMERTFVIGCQPLDAPADPSGDSPVDWADVAHPPTDTDGPVVVMHVLRFHDVDGASASPEHTPEHMAEYQTAAAKVAVKHGVRINGWFAAEGTIVGDGRSWHQVRFNEFPSKAAFMAVLFDPNRLAAQKDHRAVAIADTYTMIVRASINRLAKSV